MACVYLCGYLLTFAHFAEERHAVCHEHGAAHHIAESDALTLQGAPQVPRLHQGAKGADDHCGLFQFFRTGSHTAVAGAAPIFDATYVMSVEPKRLDRTSRQTTTSAVWRYAPKQSPPVRA